MLGTLITVAPTGAEVEKLSNPALPVSPEEIASTAKLCEEAGAAIIHVHVRDRDGRSTMDLGRIHETLAAIRESAGLIIQLSTGGAVTDNESSRIAVLDADPEMASLTCGSVNFGDEIFANRWPFMVELYREMRERSIVPEFEIFDLGHIDAMNRLLDSEGLPFGGHVHVDLVMGVPGGMAGEPATLVAAVQKLPLGATFSATGIGRSSLPVMLASLACGGNLRVGMEDTLTFAPREPVRDNAQIVQRAADLARLALRAPLAVGGARQLLGIRSSNSSNNAEGGNGTNGTE